MKTSRREVSIKKPEWIRVSLPHGERYRNLLGMLRDLKLVTVCQEANCPNIAECWGGGTATFMLMGEICTRACRFCNVKTGNPKGWLDKEEPEKIARAVEKLNLDYVVLTSVDRDDLLDEGADHFAQTVERLKHYIPNLLVEVLTPDFKGKIECINRVADSGPNVFAHNIETVESLSEKVRDKRASYLQSLAVLKWVKENYPKMITKSSLMLGLGEADQEITNTLSDLRSVGCDVVTFGQYLRPQRRHLPVRQYVSPKKFKEWGEKAESMGFLYVASGPLVRSSYRAGEFFIKNLVKKNKKTLSEMDKL